MSSPAPGDGDYPRTHSTRPAETGHATAPSATPNSDSIPTSQTCHESQHDQPETCDSLTVYHYLQQLSSLTEPELLEKTVRAGLKFLGGIKSKVELFSPADDTEEARWVKATGNLCARPMRGRTIIGVVGSTGAGKSSVINAVLDEERLLPTSCLSACTASATEVSYNYSDDPAQLYRAEIEFITLDEWLKELDGLFNDLPDSSGKVVKESSNAETDAGQALAKIRAVYPKLTKEMIERSDPESLANDPVVRHALGTTMNFQATTARILYRKVQNYVGSREKSAAASQNMEFWPLIKVVRVYTKAAALSTGAVIVDLPSVQDSNAARAAVAANYMKQCSALWIVAPMNRAVHDKTAKDLLGDQFKRQLKYDGIYDLVTFICSKTDDISNTDVADQLGLDGELADDWAQIDSISDTVRQLAQSIRDLKDQKAALRQTIDQVDGDIEVWEELDCQNTNGRTVYAPPTNNSQSGGKKKRKREAKPSGSRKNRISLDTYSDGDNDDEVSIMSDAEPLSGSDKENDHTGKKSRLVPLTEEEIDEQLAALKVRKRSLRQTRNETDSAISNHEQQIRGLEAEKQKLESQIKSLCIKRRNTHSRRAIKEDFASGMKEYALDEEVAMQLDESSFDPEREIRDYDKLALSLPIFCVCSRAYQHLRGRLERDNFINDGFKSESDTEIPQLQEHAKKMTEGGRALHNRVLLNNMNQLLTSFKLWADKDGTSQFSEADRVGEMARLTHHVAQLEQDFKLCIQECVNSLKEELAENISDAFVRTIPAAQEMAPETAGSWGSQLRWTTYKATVRRNGMWAGAAGPRDFQADLWAPIAVRLAGNWERTFQRRLPAVLDDFVRKVADLLHNFHSDATIYAREHFINSAGVTMLEQQLSKYKMGIQEIPALAAVIIQEIQREAGRSYAPAIRRI
ncbi:hypothetical protein GE09DRAFT_1250371 [Coniochaeta sp. 2T2.1]|nr:hypothetical protein GE09DRAFT_1250371 [Coniochaeta sp. 2T2.1]